MSRILLLFSVACLSLCGSLQAQEQVSRAVLEEMNLARQQPRLYARIVETSGHRDVDATREAVRFLKSVQPRPPLRWSDAMSAGALSHVRAQGPRGSTGHRGADGSRPWDRLKRFGEWGGQVGENIHYGRSNARAIVIDLIVDSGVRSRGHRKNIFNQGFGVTGISHGAHARFGSVCVINFAGSFHPTGAMGRSTAHRTAWHADKPIFRR